MPIGELATAPPLGDNLCIRCQSSSKSEGPYCKGCSDDNEGAFGFRPGGEDPAKDVRKSLAEYRP